MSYSIKPILHHAANKNKLHKIQILIIYRRMKFTLPTNYHVLKNQFQDGRCKGFKHANDINGNLIALKDKYEKLLLSVIESNPSKETLQQLFRGQSRPCGIIELTFAEYANDIIKRFKGKLGASRLIHYNTLAIQIKAFNDILLKDISPKTATQIEQHLRSLGFAQNTLNTKMKIFIAIINQAKLEKLVPDDCLAGYKKPRYIQTIPDYLTEAEIESFKKVVEASGPLRYKVAGYYYLLSCYTGFRISDLKKFSFDSIQDDKILIRATKNKEPVMIPIYPVLAEILEQIKLYPFYFTIESMRKYVKELALLAGLNRKIKVHTARHTFAIMLLNKGFTVDEVAQLLGDSKDVAKVYARVTNVQLHNKVKEKLY